MSTTEVTSVILAAVAILGTIGSVTALTFRVGRLIGTTETLITQGTADRTLLREQITQVGAQISRHEQWHMGPTPFAPAKGGP